MSQKRKPRISNIPLTLSLFMILIFGVPTTLVICLYEYHSMAAGRQEVEAEYLQAIKERLRRDLEVAVDILDYRRKEAEGQLKTRVHEVVNNTHNMMYLIETTLEEKMSEKSLRNLIGQWLAGATFFQGRGYVFAFDRSGNDSFQIQSLTREKFGQIDLSRKQDRQIVDQLLDIIRENEAGFVRYTWPLPERPDTVMEKISYVRLFRPFDWIVGVGDYPEEFERRVRTETIQTFRFFNKGGNLKGFILDDKGNMLIGDEDHEGQNKTAEQTGLTRALEKVRAEARIDNGAYAFVHDESVNGDGRSSVTFLVYGLHYAPWGWTLGTVVDLAPFHEFSRQKFGQLKKKMRNKYLFLSGVMVLAMGFAVLIGKLFARRLKTNLSAFERFLHKAGNSPDQIDLDQLPFAELHALGGYANAMVGERVKNEKTIQAVNEELLQANQRLEQMANQDGLTRVANRRFFDDALAREWARAAREDRPITLGMIDIDKFKVYNDTYGHQAGDDCLKQVARAMKGAVKRPADLLARYGGEEFVVLLPNTEIGGGKKVAGDMQRAVALLNIPHGAGPSGRVSFSMGLAAMVPQPGTGPAPLVALADQALYRAKAKGRDRIEIGIEPTPVLSNRPETSAQ